MCPKVSTKTRKPSSVRLKDIAAATDVSIATVSLALRGHSSVSKRTRNLVLSTQQQLSERHEQEAQPKAEEELCFLCCLADFPMGESVYSPLLNGMIQGSKELGIRLELTGISSDDLPLLNEGVSGVILTGGVTRAIVDHFSALGAKVVVAGNYGLQGVDTVETDSFHDGVMIAQRVAKEGHRRVAYAQLFPENYFERQFQSGLRDGLIACGIAFSPEDVLPIEDPARYHAPTVDQWLRLDPRPDAVVCISQETAELYLGEFLADERLAREALPAIYALRAGAEKQGSPRIHYYTLQMELVGRHAVSRLRELVGGDSTPYTRVIRGGTWSQGR